MAKAIEDAIKGLEKKDASTPIEPTKPTDPPQENQDKTGETTGSPQTGDNSIVMVWAAVMLMAGAGMVTTIYSRKRKHNQ